MLTLRLQKRTPRISAEMAIHEVRCANCKKVARTCHVASTGESCYECRRGKVKCSHVGKCFLRPSGTISTNYRISQRKQKDRGTLTSTSTSTTTSAGSQA
jgi:hypothetical protein